MSETIKVLLLAIIQGLTEFLPVSSSGHLALGQRFFNFTMPGLTLELLLHVGTVFAVLIYYRAIILKHLTGLFTGQKESVNFAIAIVLSMIPAIGFYGLLHDWVDTMPDNISYVAIGLIFTGVVLIATRFFSRRDPSELKEASTEQPAEVGILRGFGMGCAQAIATMAGISRSGMTITAARFMGVAPSKASEFSFIMVIPLILGGALLDFVKLLKEPAEAGSLTLTAGILGVVVSGIVGYLSIAFMVKLLDRNRFWLFGFYTIIVGAALLIFA